MGAQLKANRQAQQPQPAVQLAAAVVPVVEPPKPVAPEQGPVAAQPPAPERKPERKPEPPKKKLKGPRR